MRKEKRKEGRAGRGIRNKKIADGKIGKRERVSEKSGCGRLARKRNRN
jgi:hypothetical protein